MRHYQFSLGDSEVVLAMNRTVSIFVIGLLVGVFAATGGFAVFLGRPDSEQSQVRVLKLAHALPPEHPVHLAIMEMKRRLDEVSNGRMSLDVYPSGQLGGETECLEQVQSGALAMTALWVASRIG